MSLLSLVPHLSGISRHRSLTNLQIKQPVIVKFVNIEIHGTVPFLGIFLVPLLSELINIFRLSLCNVNVDIPGTVSPANV
jgi:hypothetical protein